MTSKHDEKHDTRLPWYRVPVLWLGIFITLLVLFGCIHLLVIGHRYADTSEQQTPTGETKALTHLFGVPLSSEPPSRSQAAEKSGEQP